jgi:hypothetical protein
MGFALPTAGASDASMQVGVERVHKVQLLIALLTAGVSDVGLQVGVTIKSIATGFVRPMVAASDVSMQVGVERVP